MAIIQCSSALSSIGVGACPCGPQGYQIPPSGSIQVDFNASHTSWTNSQRTLVRNSCCNATCNVFCSAQPAACSEGGSMIMSDATLTSGIKNPPRPPKDVSRRRNASGMRSAIGDDRKPCNCRLISTTESGATMVTYGKKVCNNDPNKCCGNCKDPFELDPSNAMKKATGRPRAPKGFHYMPDGSLMRDEDHKGFRNQATRSRFSTYWGGLKIK